MSRPSTCRLCAAPLDRTFVDLGMSPPCESYLRPDELDEPEVCYALYVRFRESCLFVQLPEHPASWSRFPEQRFCEASTRSARGRCASVRRRNQPTARPEGAR